MTEQSKVGFFPETVGMEDPKGVEWPYRMPASPSASPLLLFSNLQWFRLIMSSTALPIITLAQQQILSISSLNFSKMQLSFTISNIITLSWALTFRDNVHREKKRSKEKWAVFHEVNSKQRKESDFWKRKLWNYILLSVQRGRQLSIGNNYALTYMYTLCVCVYVRFMWRPGTKLDNGSTVIIHLAFEKKSFIHLELTN